MTPQLQSAISAVYDAFSSVPKPQTIDGCRCCIEDKEIHVMLTKPLRELSLEELSSYASSVFLTVGDEPDFHYYLPRILELVITDPGWWPSAEIFGRSLALSGWQKWPSPEREAIGRVFEAHFDELVEQGDGWEICSWLCGFASAEIPVRPFLDKLWANPPAALAFYAQNADKLPERRLGNPFWDQAPAGAMNEIVEWFYSTDVSRLILKTHGVDLNLPHLQS